MPGLSNVSEAHMLRIMRSDILTLLRPLVRTAGLFLAVALGVLAGLLVLLVMMSGGYAEALPPLAGAAALPWLPLARRGGEAGDRAFPSL
jgi:hypothetical protein